MSRADHGWLPSTPPGWTRTRVRNVCRVETGTRDTVEAVDGGEYPFFVRSETPLAIDEFAYETEAILTPGDGDVGHIFHHAQGRFNVHQRVYVFHAFRGAYPRFFYWWMSSQFRNVTDQGTAKSTVASLRRPMLIDFPVLLPPLATQRAIADFLDRETAQIDAMIEAQANVSTTLRVRANAVRASLLLRGWDGTNGVQLRRLVVCLDNHRIPLAAWERADRVGHVPYWGANSIQGYVDDALLDEDLVLLGEDGAPFLEKNRDVAFYSRGPIWPNNHIHVLRCRDGIDPRWVVHILNLVDYSTVVTGSTRLKLTQTAMNQIQMPAPPPPEEQHRLCNALDDEMARAQILAAEAQSVIDLLRERRDALITAAVTGRIDPTTGIERIDRTTEKEAS